MLQDVRRLTSGGISGIEGNTFSIAACQHQDSLSREILRRDHLAECLPLRSISYSFCLLEDCRTSLRGEGRLSLK